MNVDRSAVDWPKGKWCCRLSKAIEVRSWHEGDAGERLGSPLIAGATGAGRFCIVACLKLRVRLRDGGTHLITRDSDHIGHGAGGIAMTIMARPTMLTPQTTVRRTGIPA
jgi:hypothetical protein